MTGRSRQEREEERAQAALGRAVLGVFAALPPADKIGLPEHAEDLDFGRRLHEALCTALPKEGSGVAEAERRLDELELFFDSPENFEGAPYPPTLQQDIPF